MIQWKIAIGLAAALIISLSPMNVRAGAVALPQTGITTCRDAGGIAIPCPGTGQDGELRAGAAWPAPRFTDNGDGTNVDSLTGLIWAIDAGTPTSGSCAGGAKSWQAALNYISCLNSTGYLGRTDWRLPNVNELESLLSLSNPDSRPWLGTQGFVNVGASYWSSTTNASNTANAWYLGVSNGQPSYTGKTLTLFVWPVR
jgi:hypothetical protein